MKSRDRPPVTLTTAIGHYPWVALHFRCHSCAREARVRLAVVAIAHGLNAPIGRVLRSFAAECPYYPDSGSRSRKYGHKCGAYCPDVLSPRPPDLPPSLCGLTLIEGGKANALPAEPLAAETRKRVGGETGE